MELEWFGVENIGLVHGTFVTKSTRRVRFQPFSLPQFTILGTTMLGAILGQFLLYNFLGEILFFKELTFVCKLLFLLVFLLLHGLSKSYPSGSIVARSPATKPA